MKYSAEVATNSAKKITVTTEIMCKCINAYIYTPTSGIILGFAC